MKYKNYKSAIHNFAHSLQSVDFAKSSKLAINIIIDLYNNGNEPKVSFDFITETIQPNAADTMTSQQLLTDYRSWLPQHLNRHNCDLSILEKLKVTVYTDFENAFVPQRKKKCKQLDIISETIWKVHNKDEQVIKISQPEVIDDKFLMNGIPGF